MKPIGARGAILAACCILLQHCHAVLLADRTPDVRTMTTVVTEVPAANPENDPACARHAGLARRAR